MSTTTQENGGDGARDGQPSVTELAASTDSSTDINSLSDSVFTGATPSKPFELLPDGSGIRIHGWEISSTDGPIASSSAEEELSKQLDMKLPSMFFDTSQLTVRHAGMGFELSFDSVSALREVSKQDPGIRVKAAARWHGKDTRSDVEIGSVGRCSDWTFTTPYRGSIQPTPEDVQRVVIEQKANAENADAKLTNIDYGALRDTTLPILYSAQTILFEDELDDNGIACYKVRIRVMPSFFFILARFFLRVDSVLVRVYDTRYFFKFGSQALVCETIHREASIPQSLQHVHFSVLRDPDLVAAKLPVVYKAVENINLTSTTKTATGSTTAGDGA